MFRKNFSTFMQLFAYAYASCMKLHEYFSTFTYIFRTWLSANMLSIRSNQKIFFKNRVFVKKLQFFERYEFDRTKFVDQSIIFKISIFSLFTSENWFFRRYSTQHFSNFVQWNLYFLIWKRRQNFIKFIFCWLSVYFFIHEKNRLLTFEIFFSFFWSNFSWNFFFSIELFWTFYLKVLAEFLNYGYDFK